MSRQRDLRKVTLKLTKVVEFSKFWDEVISCCHIFCNTCLGICGVIRFHVVSCGVIRCHVVSNGVIGCHLELEVGI